MGSRLRNIKCSNQCDILCYLQIETLSQSMDEEKARQRQAIADRIAKRRQQKEESLKQLHGSEMKQELLKQRAERDSLADKQVCRGQLSHGHHL